MIPPCRHCGMHCDNACFEDDTEVIELCVECGQLPAAHYVAETEGYCSVCAYRLTEWATLIVKLTVHYSHVRAESERAA